MLKEWVRREFTAICILTKSQINLNIVLSYFLTLYLHGEKEKMLASIIGAYLILVHAPLFRSNTSTIPHLINT